MSVRLATERLEGDPVEHYFAVMERERPTVRRGNLRFELAQRFGDVDLRAKSLLDIGAGSGEVSLFAACAGASRVVALEPEAAGSSTGMRAQFDRLSRELGVQDRIELVPVTFQAYDPGASRFDVLSLIASVNHLDEQACTRLHRDKDARERYRAIFTKLKRLAAPCARVIVSDCSSHNVFADLRLKNPVARAIEWHKHQPPELWAELLAEHGFARPSIRWASFNSLRAPGRALLGNRIAAYLLTSGFCLTMALPTEPLTT